MPVPNPKRQFAHGQVDRFFCQLGPGLVTGAADDAPSGISTYSVTGASCGFAQFIWLPLWRYRARRFRFTCSSGRRRRRSKKNAPQAARALTRGAADDELRAARTDMLTGMVFAGVVMYFIIVSTGATLYQNGQHDIESARQAAEALRPLAGQMAYLLFTVGLVGTGMLGISALAGSAAYAVAEARHWRCSLDGKPRIAPKF